MENETIIQKEFRKNRKMNKRILNNARICSFMLFIIILLILFIPYCRAESYSGTVEAPATGVYTNYAGDYSGYPAASDTPYNLTIGNIENSGGLRSWVYFLPNSPGYINSMSWLDTIGTNVSEQTNFEAYIGSTHVGSGTLGFQRTFNWLGQEQGGYVWYVFSSWNSGSMSGTQLLNLTYEDTDLHRLRMGGYGYGGTNPTKVWINNGGAGSYTISTYYQFKNDYTLNYPEGIGIAGLVKKNFTSTEIYPSKVSVVNETSDIILTGDGVVNNNDFNFTIVNTNNVKLAILDNNGNWYNNSFTFNTNPVTPTPTTTLINASITPTPSPTPQTNDTLGVTVILKDITTNQPVTGVAIGLSNDNDFGAGWFNVTTNDGSYHFTGYGTGGDKPFNVNNGYTFSFTKSGYKTDVISYGGFDRDLVWYMTPTSYVPTSSAFTLNLGLMSQVGNRLISGSLIGSVLVSNQSSAWTTSINNPSSSQLLFAGLTPQSSYKIDVNVEGYKSYTGYFSSSSSMAGTTQYYNAYLEPSQTQPSNYLLTASPNQGSVNDTYTLAITGDLSNAKSITYKYQANGGGQFYPFVVGGYQSTYQKIGGNWKIWDGSAWQASSLPQSISVKFNPTSSAAVYGLTVYIVSSSDITYTATSSISIIQTGQVPLKFRVLDGSASMTFIFPYTAHVYDMNNQVWINKTVTASSLWDDSELIYLNPHTNYEYTISAINYRDSPLSTDSISTTAYELEVDLYPSSTLTGANTTLYANVKSGVQPFFSIPNVLVTFSEGANVTTCYTNTNGQCSITARAPVLYSVTAGGISGYSNAASSITTSTTDTNTVYLTLIPTSVVPTETYVPVTVTPVTAEPTKNLTPYVTPATWVGAGAACGGNSTNFIESFKSQLACNGFETAMAQSLVIASLIIMIFMMAGAEYGGSAGAAIGSLIGFVLAFALGVIPFVILALIIALLILVSAVLVFAKSGGGS